MKDCDARTDEVTKVLMQMMSISSNVNYMNVMQAGVMFMVFMCMQGGAEVDDMDTALSAFDEAFKEHWKIAFAVRSQYISDVAGHA